MILIKIIKPIYWQWLRTYTSIQQFFANFRPTSAAVALKYLSKNKLDIAQISVNDIDFIYKNLKSWTDAPSVTGKKILTDILEPLKKDTSVDDDCMGVIVETRSHSALEFVVCNFVEQTGKRVQLFHGKENTDFILNSKIGDLVKNGVVFLVKLDIDSLNANLYNSLFLIESFWRLIVARNKVIVFQTDSVICNASSYQLSDFIHFDYIGAWWHNRLIPNGLILDGGVGGFSIRNYELSIESVRRFSNHTWQGGEDDFFAFHIELLGGKVGKKSDCIKFCTQNEFLSESYSAHQVNNLNPEALEKFLRYCPDAEKIL
ncbi:DUF5672 family protein [Colwellia sp. MB02u-9]|uniref:DUF5672 family protein n=1 Tax=Colwellia sp. MB02u-9 TaxID=2759823 RepID=UPI0015F466A3|nr:DUF5672 family protein [Colwellia sp. MB02u-9]MBA6295152.1 hypothetical protein [Colwellia sp. MB02u-9]